MPVPIAVVGNEGTVNRDVVPELQNGLVQLAAVVNSIIGCDSTSLFATDPRKVL